jgi:hypothetical protein
MEDIKADINNWFTAVNDELVNLNNCIWLLELKESKQIEHDDLRSLQCNKHGNNYNVQYFLT